MVRAEVFAIVTGAAATFQQCINLYQSIRCAINSRKNLRGFINQQWKEARQTSRLIEVVKKEKALQTSAVISALQDVDEAGKKLNARLRVAKKSLEKSHIRLIGNALFPDPEEEKQLQAELKELERAKENLNICILLHNVGATRDINNSIKVQTISIDELGREIKEILSTRNSPRIEKMPDRRGELTKEEFFAAEELSNLWCIHHIIAGKFHSGNHNVKLLDAFSDGFEL
ncbi:hypothetical protein UCREL1_856 [Eutypa lata UCREL1]|uniref:Uncharacterized protein n=1 Tax=Eutypa lata (strain UCR-EL1) TaxID=1287681 RepID=M7TQB5_EUTLA|nr:hypothetical protein UCREL1_856 [Eutypa lata UCREL1]